MEAGHDTFENEKQKLYSAISNTKNTLIAKYKSKVVTTNCASDCSDM